MHFRTLITSRVGAFALSLFIAFCGTAISVQLERALVKSEQAAAQSRATREALVFGNELQQKMEFHGMLAATIANAIGIDTDFDQEAFSAQVAPFFLTNPDIINVAVAEGLVVRHVHPYDANKSVIGLDYRNVPAQLSAIQTMQRTKAPVLTGPVDLVQGGNGYIHRAPVFVDSVDGNAVFWGLVSVVTRETELLAAAAQRLSGEFDTAITIQRQGDEQRSLAWGNAQVLDFQPVTETVRFGDQAWEIAMAPGGGWPVKSSVRDPLVWLTVLTVSSLIGLVLWARHLLITRVSSWEKLSKAIEVIDDGFALYDADDRLVMCNSKYRSFYNASAHLMITGASFEDIIRGGVQNGQYRAAEGREEEWIAERLARHKNPSGPMEQLLDDGRWLKVFEAKMDDGSTVGFRVDITELKQAKQAAEQANLAKTEFLNTVSHEIRTPLSAVLGYASILRNIQATREFSALQSFSVCPQHGDHAQALVELQATIERYARRIDTNGIHLHNIIDDILYWTQGERAENEVEFKPVELHRVVESVVEQLGVIADQKGIEMRCSVSDVYVTGDETRLKQVLLNLVGNALKFTETGSVTVQCGFDDDRVAVRVVDTGCGIPAVALSDIFEPFKQLDVGNARRFGGCGLGLAICKDIAAKHGGDIGVSSTPGSGSTFTLTLPHVQNETLAA